MNIEQTLQLLDIQEVTTERQKKNGTREFELPIKAEYSKRKIRVASFASGYVRCQLSDAYCYYQLNKRCESEPEYYEVGNGLYRKFTTRTCKLIPNEQDRLEYLLNYCIKNYYIGKANQVANGDYVPKWRHEDEIKRTKELHVWQEEPEVKVIVNGQRYNVI